MVPGILKLIMDDEEKRIHRQQWERAKAMAEQTRNDEILAKRLQLEFEHEDRSSTASASGAASTSAPTTVPAEPLLINS